MHDKVTNDIRAHNNNDANSIIFCFLDSLTEELIGCGIFTNFENIEPGVWKGDIDTTRVFNQDETPQFKNYGVDGTSSGLAFAAKGESCKKMIRENRESVSLSPIVSLAGKRNYNKLFY